MRLLLISVSGLGLFSTALLLTDPPPADPSNIDYDDSSPSLFSMNSIALKSRRGLASAEAAPEQKPDSIFEFSCSEPKQIFETIKPRFRLKGVACNDNPQIEASEKSEDLNPGATQVQNESNGYVATVFHRTPTNFTTDYINLSQGENKIKIIFETDNGKIEKSLIVIRR